MVVPKILLRITCGPKYLWSRILYFCIPTISQDICLNFIQPKTESIENISWSCKGYYNSNATSELV